MRRVLLTGMACAALAAAVGCGDDDENGAAGGAQTGQQPAPAPTQRTQTAEDRTTAPEETIVVRIRDFAFHPTRVEAKVGQTIEWVNDDDAPHNAVQQNGEGGLRTDTFGKGGRGSYTLDEAGTINYICTVHPQMKGAIVATG